MSNEQKMISIEPIPLTKLTVVINNFVANTITHLNKLSVKGEEKLSEFDNKLNDLDAMTTLLEAKLNSLPDNITSKYPPLEPVNLDDIIPIEPIQVIPKEEHQDDDDDNQQSQKSENDGNEKEGQKEDEQKPEEGNNENLSPVEDLENFLNENEGFKDLYKKLKLGIPSFQLFIKAKMNGYEENLLNDLLKKDKKVNSNIS